jgi:uncharacterized protein (TIGR02246 family)
MMRAALGLCLVALFPLGSTRVAAAEDLKAAIEAANRQFSEAVAKGDGAACGALYTATARAFPPNAAAVEGRDAITKMWSSLLASGIRSLALTAVEVTGGGDAAQEVGTYVLKAPDGTVADEGKYVVLWKKEGGRWRLHRDIWNSNAPATKP